MKLKQTITIELEHPCDEYGRLQPLAQARLNELVGKVGQAVDAIADDDDSSWMTVPLRYKQDIIKEKIDLNPWEYCKKYGDYRDSQRAKLYRAQQDCSLWMQLATKHPLSLDDCQRLVNQITRSRWWGAQVDKLHELLQSWGHNGIYERHPQLVVTAGGPGQKHAHARAYGNVIALPRHQRSLPIVLHELSHFLCPRFLPSHGRMYCKLYLAMVKRWDGDNLWRMLKDSFVRNRVKHVVREGHYV